MDISVDITRQLASTKEEILNKLKENDIEAIKLKYDQVYNYMMKSSVNIDSIQQMKNKRLELPKKRMILRQKVAEYVKTVLQVLDVTWSIIEEFKHGYEMDKNIQFDRHYTCLVDTLLLKVKILQITVLITTYENQDFLLALESLKNLLELRYIEAQTTLEYTTQKLKEYNDIGPEFITLSKAYNDLLYKIQSTKDDIDRLKNN